MVTSSRAAPDLPMTRRLTYKRAAERWARRKSLQMPRLVSFAVVFGLATVGITLGCKPQARPHVADVGSQCQAGPKPNRKFETLLVEWDVEPKSSFETAFRTGGLSGLPVRYKGCEMEVLPHCSMLAGSYEFSRVTPKERLLTFDSSRKVYADAPLGAAKLVGELGRNQRLDLRTMTVGRYTLHTSSVVRNLLEGDCDGVTHVVTGVTVGAYEVSAHSSRGAKASATVHGAGAGVEGSRGVTVVGRDGEIDACFTQDTGQRCIALVSVALEPVDDPAKSRARQTCPRGMAFVPSTRRDDAYDSRRPGGSYDAPNYESGFCLDRLEVTTGDYVACSKGRDCMDLPRSASEGVAEALGIDDELVHELCTGTASGSNSGRPVNCVDWRAARAYCESRGARLPTRNEWRYAAMGAGQGRTYPWGQERPTERHANFCNKECARADFWRDPELAQDAAARKRDGAVGPAKGGHYRAGIGRFEVFDLAGNVAEWTENGHVMGGSFLSIDPDELKARSGGAMDPDTRRPDVGFRCAADPS